MKYIKTYEGLFSFLKGGIINKIKQNTESKQDLIRKTYGEVTEMIVDSMLDIFDKYEIDQLDQKDKEFIYTVRGSFHQFRKREVDDLSDIEVMSYFTPPSKKFWYYRWEKVSSGYESIWVKCGIEIYGIESIPNRLSFSDDVRDIMPIIDARTDLKNWIGVSLNDPILFGNKCVIDFPKISYEDISIKNESNSLIPNNSVLDMVDDCLRDLVDDGFEVHRCVISDDNSEFPILCNNLEVTISKIDHNISIPDMGNGWNENVLFSLDDILPHLNDLSSHLSGLSVDLKFVKYKTSSRSIWKILSMDPIAGEIKGNTILGIKSLPYKNTYVNDISNISSVKVIFEF